MLKRDFFKFVVNFATEHRKHGFKTNAQTLITHEAPDYKTLEFDIKKLLKREQSLCGLV